MLTFDKTDTLHFHFSVGKNSIIPSTRHLHIKTDRYSWNCRTYENLLFFLTDLKRKLETEESVFYVYMVRALVDVQHKGPHLLSFLMTFT